MSLWASACIVFATVETHVDWVSVAIANANISAGGAIRQAHDVITWDGKLQKLSARGVNAEAVISQFNGQSTQAVALKGARKMSIQALLRPECHDALAALVDLVGTIRPAQVFWEEHNWANKRILPGYRNQYRSGKELWQGALRVTTNSFTLFAKPYANNRRSAWLNSGDACPQCSSKNTQLWLPCSVGWWRRAWRSNRP